MQDPSVPIDFPEQEAFTDCTGRTVLFSLQCDEAPTGWSVSAEEISDSRLGYRFQAFSPANPYLALGELRGKIRRGLATRYLTADSRPQLSHDVACGHIDWDAETEGIILVIDGRAVSITELARILATYEGWQFELRIKDPSE